MIIACWHTINSYATKISGSESGDKVLYNMRQGFDITRYTGDTNAAETAHQQIDEKKGPQHHHQELTAPFGAANFDLRQKAPMAGVISTLFTFRFSLF